MKLLANENFPKLAVDELREAGHDVCWVRTEQPGSSDEDVLEWAQSEGRVLVTFDKDFGELAFRFGLPASCGVILFRFAIPSPETCAERILSVLNSRSDWEGQFAVVDESRIRLRPLTEHDEPE